MEYSEWFLCMSVSRFLPLSLFPENHTHRQNFYCVSVVKFYGIWNWRIAFVYKSATAKTALSSGIDVLNYSQNRFLCESKLNSNWIKMKICRIIEINILQFNIDVIIIFNRIQVYFFFDKKISVLIKCNLMLLSWCKNICNAIGSALILISIFWWIEINICIFQRFAAIVANFNLHCL